MEKMNARKKAARAARLRKQRTRRALLTLCLMLAVAVVSIGGTIAWLTAKTSTITNTFTVGDINIDLYEHTRDANGDLTTTVTHDGISDYKIIPGTDLHKDPTAVVKANSEKCYLFVKVEAAGWNNSKIAYSIADGWTELTSANTATGTKVYYRVVNAATADQPFGILNGNKVTVSGELTKAEVDEITSDWTLKFTAYAIQHENFSSAELAWAEVSK